MQVIGKSVLIEFKMVHTDAKKQTDAWITEAEDAQWSIPSDIKRKYSSASFLAENNVVFNIKGNKYRFLTKINYANKIVLVKKAGTHEEYMKWKI